MVSFGLPRHFCITVLLYFIVIICICILLPRTPLKEVAEGFRIHEAYLKGFVAFPRSKREKYGDLD